MEAAHFQLIFLVNDHRVFLMITVYSVKGWIGVRFSVL